MGNDHEGERAATIESSERAPKCLACAAARACGGLAGIVRGSVQPLDLGLWALARHALRAMRRSYLTGRREVAKIRFATHRGGGRADMHKNLRGSSS
jgi:hypothetical protein